MAEDDPICPFAARQSGGLQTAVWSPSVPLLIWKTIHFYAPHKPIFLPRQQGNSPKVKTPFQLPKLIFFHTWPGSRSVADS